MGYRVAVASMDGKVIHEHFGRATQFLIFEVEDRGDYRLVEVRKLNPVCNGNDHEEGAMDKRVEELADCGYILVAKIGMVAERILEAKGIHVYEVPDFIERALEKVISIENNYDWRNVK